MKIPTDPIIQAVITTGLADEQIKQAVLNYIRALTPDQERFREVYRRQSEETRCIIFDAPDPRTGLPNYVRQLNLFMLVYFDDRAKVGKVAVFLDYPDAFDDHWREHLPRTVDQTMIDEDAFTAGYYAAAIDYALTRWPEYLREFEQRTLPIEAENA